MEGGHGLKMRVCVCVCVCVCVYYSDYVYTRVSVNYRYVQKLTYLLIS